MLTAISIVFGLQCCIFIKLLIKKAYALFRRESERALTAATFAPIRENNKPKDKLKRYKQKFTLSTFSNERVKCVHIT